MAEQWILDLTNELQLKHDTLDQERSAKSIYRVSKILTDVNSEAYKPKVVSFGPYHHDCLHLHSMEKHKYRALIQFLRRIAKASKTPEDVLFAMRNVETRLLAFYDGLDIEYGIANIEDRCLERSRFCDCFWCNKMDRFLIIMIVDSCFALEVMFAKKRYRAKEETEYDPFDPVFGVERIPYMFPDLWRDMLVLENQIPLLALTTLADIDGSGIEDVSRLIKPFCNISSHSYGYDLTGECFKRLTEQSFHILDLYRKSFTDFGEYVPSYEVTVPSATELRNAGVSFRMSDTMCFRDISFKGGVLSLPPIEIDDATESVLRNLMAFEREHTTDSNEVTAYVFFMDKLINTVDDVALLRTKNIITGWEGCDGIIATLFNRMTKDATLVVYNVEKRFDVNDRLISYCRNRMRRWRASFVETYLKNWVFTSFSTYLKNPWVFTLLGGLFLLALTMVQTLYTVRQFYGA